MVRMSDLVRGTAAVPPLPPIEKEPEEHEKKPAETRTARPPAARLALRTMDMTAAAPAAPALAALVPPARPVVVGTTKSVFEDLHVFLAGVKDQLTSGAVPAWPDLEQIIHRVVASLEGSAEVFWLANSPSAASGIDYLVAHQSRVAIIAARIGLNVGYDHARAVSLGMAGALIDIALWEAPEGLLRGLDSLSGEEQAVFRSHPQRSAALLTNWGVPAEIVEAVLQHHERAQGQGFPQGLTDNAISHLAKILGLVDAYTGLTLPSSGRPGLRPHEAIREIVRSKNESFSPALIKALLSEVSVFPPGTLVRLSTGEVGRVTAVNRNHPLRPRVDVVSDSKGNRPMMTKAIDLSETPFLYITGPVPESTK